MFSGSMFHSGPDGRLQVQPISWDRECSFRLRAGVWREAVDRAFPNSAPLILRRDIFDRLAAFRRSRGAMSWEDALEELLDAAREAEVAA
jgi:hypothetical protein